MERITWISRSRTSCWIFWKKIIKKIKYSRSLSKPESYCWGHWQPHNFFPISRHFRITQNQVIRSGKITCNLGKIFFYRLSQRESFLFTGEPAYVYSTMSITLFWWSRRFISSSLLYFSFVIDNARPTCPACVASVAAFYHCWSYTEHGSDLWIRCVVYILYYINIVCSYEIWHFIWFLIW